MCGGFINKKEGITICPMCNCKLITEDEYFKRGCRAHIPVVECPYCHSTDTKKISSVSKVVNTALFGIFSTSRNSKQWHCNKCGSDW